MKTAYFTAVRRIEIRDEPRPRISRPHEVLLRIDRLGVCGSDVHYFTDGRIGDDLVPFPASLGHECAGTVVEIGEGVEGLTAGDRVAVDPAVACGVCDQCRAGRVNTCRRMNFMGCPGQEPGVAAEFRVLPAENCIPVPESMSLDQAALAEPLAVGLYALQMADPRPGANIAILGSGPIGLSVLLAAGKINAAAILTHRFPLARIQDAFELAADYGDGVVKAMIDVSGPG